MGTTRSWKSPLISIFYLLLLVTDKKPKSKNAVTIFLLEVAPHLRVCIFKDSFQQKSLSNVEINAIQERVAEAVD